MSEVRTEDSCADTGASLRNTATALNELLGINCTCYSCTAAAAGLSWLHSTAEPCPCLCHYSQSLSTGQSIKQRVGLCIHGGWQPWAELCMML